MPWVRYDDTTPDSVKFTQLASPMQRLALLGAHVTLVCTSAVSGTDGLLDKAAFKAIPGTIQRALLTSVMGKAPLVHRRGDECECLAGRGWPDGAEYCVHDYLAYNPAAAEYELSKVQRKERRNPSMVRRVRNRDRDLCRYCGNPTDWADRRGPRGGQVDHVDPMQAGEVNLVVCCRDCNQKKGKRTPDEAGMRLLPAPDSDGLRSMSQSNGRPIVEVPAQANSYASRDGSGRVGVESSASPNDEGPVRTAGDGNPYLREAITGPKPQYHTGVPPIETREEE